MDHELHQGRVSCGLFITVSSYAWNCAEYNKYVLN